MAKRNVESAQENLNHALAQLADAERPEPDQPGINSTLTFSYHESGITYRVVAIRNDTMRWSINRWRTTNLAGNDSYPTRWESSWDALVAMIEEKRVRGQLILYPSKMITSEYAMNGFTP